MGKVPRVVHAPRWAAIRGGDLTKRWMERGTRGKEKGQSRNTAGRDNYWLRGISCKSEDHAQDPSLLDWSLGSVSRLVWPPDSSAVRVSRWTRAPGVLLLSHHWISALIRGNTWEQLGAAGGGAAAQQPERRAVRRRVSTIWIKHWVSETHNRCPGMSGSRGRLAMSAPFDFDTFRPC